MTWRWTCTSAAKHSRTDWELEMIVIALLFVTALLGVIYIHEYDARRYEEDYREAKARVKVLSRRVDDILSRPRRRS